MFDLRGKVTIASVVWLFMFMIYLSSYNLGAGYSTIELFQTLPAEQPVSSAGDVNGDGYVDIIIGMPSINNTGEAFIYFGGELIDDIPDVLLIGEEIGDEFGTAVSSAGDVNGDGYNDVVVGAPCNDAIADDAGKSYIFFGGSPMDNLPDIILTGEHVEDYFGYSVSSAFDVNKDGFDDVLIGAPYYDKFGTQRCGRVYLFQGGEPMDNIVDMTITGQEEKEKLGFSISSAGDVNNDGYFDIIVGTLAEGNGQSGWAYIFLGGNPMDNITDVIFTGEFAGDQFGKAVSSAGDLNKDGYHDVIIGAPRNDLGGLDAGKVYLYLGGDPMNNVSDRVWIGKNDASLGYAVTNATDINKDGFDDIIIGAYQNRDINGDSVGTIYIYFGNVTVDNLEEYILYGYEDFRAFGISVSAGDINNDGYCDIIVGSYDYAYIFGPNLAPYLTIIEPDGISDLADSSYIIIWTDFDPDDDATVTLYYCAEYTDNPTLIIGSTGISEDNETDQFVWDTSNMNSGSYYIKAKIDDGVNLWVWVYSPGKVTINHSPIITITKPDSNNNIADENFTITWIDFDDEDNATISIYYDIDNMGNNGTLIVSGLGEDDELDMYTWNVTNIPDGYYYIYGEIDDGG